MAISANTVFEVRTTGSDNNGGGFVTGASGTDYSQQDAAQATLTTATTVNSTNTVINVALGDYTVTAADVGNILQITGGTATKKFYQIISVDTVNNRWTIDSGAGTVGQTVVGAMGGALGTPGKAAAVPQLITGNNIWVKAGTYTLSTSTAGAGGPVVLLASQLVKMEGYSSVRGDRAGRPSINAGSVTTIAIVSAGNGATQPIVHIEVNGNSGASVDGFSANGNRASFVDCKALNCVNGYRGGANNVVITRCGAVSCTTGYSNTAQSSITRSFAQACGTGFTTTGIVHYSLCVAADCTGKGFFLGISNLAADGCTAYGCGGDGFDFNSLQSAARWCVATGNAGWGFNNASLVYLEGCASYNNTSGRANTASYDLNAIILTSDPWVAAGSDDFRPNATGGAGASLRNAGGGVFAQTDSKDVGAVQHSDS